ncbi:MAG: type II toxin-antitoxin system RelE/ParE family toxin [Cyclobacteriaceae bacterium]
MPNKFTVLWSDESKTDLDTIFDSYSEYSMDYAKNVVSSVLSREEQLSTFPLSGSYQYPDIFNNRYRYLVEGNYKIIYHVSENESIVYVDTIFDTRQEPSKLRLI